MKYKLFLIISISFFSLTPLYSQVCPNLSDIGNTNVCGVYGDGNGNSNWNWELNDPLNAQYCYNWYARTATGGFLVSMGSPFVNPSSGKLKIISDELDYTKAKGWELLQRKFGCQTNVSHPYFVLYNRYSGMVRVYVFLANTSVTSGQIMMTMTSVNNHRPATLSAAREYMITPDKYLANAAGTSSEDVLVSINESVGGNNWAVGEFYTMLDHNIESPVFNNGSIEVSVYGVTTNTLQAKIEGTSTTAGSVKDAMFAAKNVTTGGPSFNFTATAERFIKLAKSFGDFASEINKSSQKKADALQNSHDSVHKKYGEDQRAIQNASSTASNFANFLSSVSQFATGASKFAGLVGKAVNLAGNLIGLFKGSSSTPAANPTFSVYNLTLHGELVSNTVLTKFVMKLPAASPAATDFNNATYYNGPLGIANLTTTPIFDTLEYHRRILLPDSYSPRNTQRTLKYAAYRLQNDLQIVVNAGPGLVLESVEGALVAKVVTLPQETGLDVSFDPLVQNPISHSIFKYFNHMRADIEANRLEITEYDVDTKHHTVQTPYRKLECLKGASFNLHVPVMKAFVRIRATLKRTNGTGELIYFIRDYEAEKVAGNPADIPANVSVNTGALPPYANYAIAPNTNAAVDINTGNVTLPPADIIYPDIVAINDVTLSQPYAIKMNRSITTSATYRTTVTCPTSPGVVFRAGGSVILNPKFEATLGSVFTATTDFGYTPVQCVTPLNLTYNYTGNYYNAPIIAQREMNTSATVQEQSEIVKLFPNPANNMLYVNSKQEIKIITVFDISGRVQRVNYKMINAYGAEVDVSALSNGVYFISLSGNIKDAGKFMVVK